MAKLNAAELAKFSKRFYGNQVGQYVFAKVLDNIQVSIKNVHIMYIDGHCDLDDFIFGLRFSSLTILNDTRKQNVRSMHGKTRAGQAKKVLKLTTLGIYCNILEDNIGTEDDPTEMPHNLKFDLKRYDYLINPFDLTINLVVNKSGMLDASPAYAVVAELTSMVVLLNEVQLAQILKLWDHLSTCSLRERYGRYRPDHTSLLQKIDGWPLKWWHYAQQSILADVRQRLKKTSWSSLGWRLTQRRNYVNLYRRKLELIQQNQHVGEEILLEVEKMDRECDIDDILKYRSIAESQIQDCVLPKTDPAIDTKDDSNCQDREQNNETSVTRLRGWLNWLSLGMLGAGGTADSSSFAGVVSDKIIQDIYVATESQPLYDYTLSESSPRNMALSSMIRCDIDHVTMTVSSKKHHVKEIGLLFLDGVGLECKTSEEYLTISFSIKCAKITNPCNDSTLLTSEKIPNGNVLSTNSPCFYAQIKSPPAGCPYDLSIEGVLQSIEITLDLDFLKDISEFLTVLEEVQFHSQRVISSLNGFIDGKARVLSKAEYIYLTRTKIIWDVRLCDVDINIPPILEGLESINLAINLGTFHLMSKPKKKSDYVTTDLKELSFASQMDIFSAYKLPSNFEVDDLYEQLEIDVVSLEGRAVSTKSHYVLPVFAKTSATFVIGLCLLLDEPLLKQFNAHCHVSLFEARLSSQLLITSTKMWLKKKNIIKEGDELDVVTHLSGYSLSWFSASAQLDHFSLHLDLDDDPKQSSVLSVSLAESSIGYTLRESAEFRLLVRFMSISGYELKAEATTYILCSSRNWDFDTGSKFLPGQGLYAAESFALYYQTHINGSRTQNKLVLEVNQYDFHFEPELIEILQQSLCRIFTAVENLDDNLSRFVSDKSPIFSKEVSFPIRYGVDISEELPSNESKSFCLFIADVSFKEVRVHFHDSSSILGTLCSPLSCISFFFKGDEYWEASFRSGGLSITSPWSNTSWSSPNVNEILWGPSSPTVTQSLGIQIKKSRKRPELIEMDFSLVVEQVKFILQSEFLAMIIGYFSLPCWILQRKGQPISKHEQLCPKFKFKIVDSSILLPVENKAYCAQFRVPIVDGIFIPEISSAESLKHVSADYLIPQVNLPDMIDLVSVSMLGASLSVVLCEGGTVGSMSESDSGVTQVTFLDALDADVCFAIPQCEKNDNPTFVSVKSDSCRLVVDEKWFFEGIGVVSVCVDELSNIGYNAKNFTSDALHYIQLKRMLKEANDVANQSPEIPVNMRMCLNALSLKLVQSATSEVLAGINTKATVLVNFRKNKVDKADVDIMYFILQSYLNSVILLSFLSDSPNSYMRISFFQSYVGLNELQFHIPGLDLWLHFSDWNNIINLFTAFRGYPNRASYVHESSPIQSEAENLSEVPDLLPSFDYSVDSWKNINLVIKSDKNLSFHVPFDDTKRSMGHEETNKSLELWRSILGEKASFVQGLDSRYLTFTVQTRDMVLSLSNAEVITKCSIGRAKMIVKVTEEQGFHSIPVIQFILQKISTKFHGNLSKIWMEISDITVETLSMNLLQEVASTLDNIHFEPSGAKKLGGPVSSIFFHVHLAKLSMLFSDQRVISSGPIFDITFKNLLVKRESSSTMTIECQLSVNYKNFVKVVWEPIIEPWSFHMELVQNVNNDVQCGSKTNQISLCSQEELNLNLTESLVEAAFLMYRMINDKPDISDSHTGNESSSHPTFGPVHKDFRNCAPYIISNETSLPLSFRLFYGPSTTESGSFILMNERNVIQPGFSEPVYIEEPVGINLQTKTAYSSERLLERKLNLISHYHISIEFDGSSGPSKPMSMDLVGTSYFEVNFSKTRASETCAADDEASVKSNDNESCIGDPLNELVVPVVFNVAMHGYSKMIRMYSTVILVNETSKPLELRFDVPFGVSHKILGPIQPGKEFPLPVHLAKAVGMRWRPSDSGYYWSEAYSLSKILLNATKHGFMRSFVCYPSILKNDPFRCCISVEDRCVVYPYGSKGGSSLHIDSTSKKFKFNGPEKQNDSKSGRVSIRQVRLTTPLLLKNNLPSLLSVTIESSGVATSISLSELDVASIFYVDSSHELDITFTLEAYDPVTVKFPRAEIFAAIARLHETRFIMSDRPIFNPCGDNAQRSSVDSSLARPCEPSTNSTNGLNHILGPVCIKVDKIMDAYSGAREISISVPLLLYNFTGIPLRIINENHQNRGHPHFIPVSYSFVMDPDYSTRSLGVSVLRRKFVPKFFAEFPTAEDFPEDSYAGIAGSVYYGCRVPQPSSPKGTSATEIGGVKAYMYCPPGYQSKNNLVVRLQSYSRQHHVKDTKNDTWSSPFSLVPPSGSTSVIIPQEGTSAVLVSVTSSQAFGDLGHWSTVVIFQPRYVIYNSCKKGLYYKQKGTSDSHSIWLDVGHHSHLHWTDRTRDLMLSVRFDERGGQWSGSFLPDSLGDTQVKLRNHVSGALDLIRVEIQNAGLLVNKGTDLDSSDGNSGTYLILLSDDDSGFMPYRIDNFSMERLRIYQQKCETVEMVLHPYSSCQYAWDEPCCPHRLVIEVPGEHILGTYNLDDVKEFPLVCLASSLEKPERKFSIAVRAEGATKVLSIADSRFHSPKDIKEVHPSEANRKNKLSQQDGRNGDFISEKIILSLPFIGISLINSSPQELIYVSAKETTLILMQNSEKQKFSFQISSLQIDNQLPDAPFPILLYFSHGRRNTSTRDIGNRTASNVCGDTHDSDLFFAFSRWREESSFLSFKYLSLRFAPLSMELEELLLLKILAFSRAVSLIWEKQAVRDKYLDKNYKHRLPQEPGIRKYLLAKHQKRIYIEKFELAPIELALSFSSNPWLVQKDDLLETESSLYARSAAFQSGLMSLADVEGVPIHLKELILTNFMASHESIHEIVAKHYTKQLLHEMYKIFGSAGLIGNPMGFARNLGIGIKDFLHVSSKGIVQSPAGLITGVARGSKSLIGSTIYAMSSAASQFSKAVHKGIVTLTFDGHVDEKIEKQKNIQDSQGKGIVDDVLEGLTGLLQSPIRGAEKHGLPGIISGVALGAAGLVARPAVSILETTEKAALSIKRLSSPQQPKRFRMRLPRPLARDLPLSPYSWEEAIGVSTLSQADSSRLKDELFVKCRALKSDGQFIIMTERLVLIMYTSALVGLGKPGFPGVADVTWEIESEMGISSIIHMDREGMVVSIVGSRAETLTHQKSRRVPLWEPPASLPLSQMTMELLDEGAAEDVLQTIASIKEQGSSQSKSRMIIHRSNIR
ncbi:vacuolar protein sorting-associated protein, putative (DUF1162) isoform X2 [Wolffia australiana]